MAVILSHQSQELVCMVTNMLFILEEHHTGLVSQVGEFEGWETLMELQAWDSCSQPPQLETLQPLQVQVEVEEVGCRVWWVLEVQGLAWVHPHMCLHTHQNNTDRCWGNLKVTL